MNILVTGGAGFIGSHVVDAFINHGHNVFVVDDLSSGKMQNLHPNAKFYHLAIGDPDVEKIFKNHSIDMVAHLAAQIDVRKSVADPGYDAKINILDSIKILEYSVKYGVKKIIYSSTGGAIYGEAKYIPADENHPIRPLAPYGVSKYAFEKYVEYFKDMYGLDYTILRYANVYGPRQDPHGEAGVVAIFSNLLLEDKDCKIFGDGEQTRDYVFVGDVVRANLIALEKGSGEVMNIGTGFETSVNELYKKMSRLMGIDRPAIYEPARPGEVNRISLSYKHARKVFNWEPEVYLDEGLKQTIEFFDKLRALKK
jgi:UDP-glucose 4-epimerase